MLERLLVAVVAGLFGMVPVLVKWLVDRGAARGRHNRIQRLSTELDFLERWIKLSGEGQNQGDLQVAPPSQAVQADLTSILEEYRFLKEQELTEHVSPAKVSFARQAMLMFRPFTGRAWLIHTVFYFLIIFAVAMIVADLQAPTYDPDTGENEFKYLLIGILVILGPPLVLLQRAAVRLRMRELHERSDSAA